MFMILLQILIIVSGTSAKLMVGSRKYHTRRWGYILGVCTEVLWSILFYYTKLPLMVGLSGLYAIAWYAGLHRHPRKGVDRVERLITENKRLLGIIDGYRRVR